MRRFEWWFIDHFIWVILGLIGLLIGLLIWAEIEEKREADEHRARGEVCVEEKDTTSTTYVMSGKVLVPITTTNTSCKEWAMPTEES